MAEHIEHKLRQIEDTHTVHLTQSGAAAKTSCNTKPTWQQNTMNFIQTKLEQNSSHEESSVMADNKINNTIQYIVYYYK